MNRDGEYSIEVEISSTGEIQTTVQGVQGSGCEALTAWLEELGETVEHYRTKDWTRQQTRQSRTRVGR
jgi:hypothetical protein